MSVRAPKHAQTPALVAPAAGSEPLNLQALNLLALAAPARAGRANYSCAALGADGLALARPPGRAS